MISLLLFRQIAQLFVAMAMGWLLVKLGKAGRRTAATSPWWRCISSTPASSSPHTSWTFPGTWSAPCCSPSGQPS